MSLKIDRVQLEIVIQQDSARQKLIELEGKMKDMRKELRGMKEGTDEWVKKSGELKKVQKEYDSLFEKIGIGSLSVVELRNRQKELNAILNKLPGDSPLYKQYKQQLDDINLRMKELKGNAVETKFSLSKLADGFNRYAGMAAGFLASLTGITLAVRKSVDDFAALEEAEANVRKYTGMTREEVKDLNEEFKKMDTRAARTELNDLASDAGRLGIKSKQELLEFAEAGNVIRVSLGEDLGKDAIKNIGKLAQMFGDADKMGLKQAMLAVGSSINEVAQNSSAAETYLVDFTARLAGVGNQANMTVPQIMGFASVLDQNMLQVEMSATALQGVLMKMFKNPEKLAQIAGLEVKKFTELVKKDANEALIQLLDTLGKKGGMDKLAPVFDEMKLDGARAASVLSVLAGKIKDVRSEQTVATNAFSDGTSVVNEFNIKNNTLQASIEKAKKKFQEISYELGEKLAPHMGSVISTGGLMVRGMVALVSILAKYGGTLVALALLLGTYITVVKLQHFWATKLRDIKLKQIAADALGEVKLRAVIAAEYASAAAKAVLSKNTAALNVAYKGFFKTLGLNPIAGIITLVAALTYGMYRLHRGQKDNNKEAKAALDISMKAKESTGEEVNRIEVLRKALNDNNKSYTERKAALDKLKEMVPEYHASLTTEGQLIDNNSSALDKYVEKIKLTAMTQQASAKLTEAQAAYSKWIAEQGSNAAKFYWVNSSMDEPENKGKGLEEVAAKNGISPSAMRAWNAKRDVFNQEIQIYENLLKNYSDQILALEEKYKPKEKEEEEEKEDGGGGGGLDDKKLKKLLQKKEEELKKVMNKEQNQAKEQFMAKKITEEEQNKQLYDAEIKFLTSKKALLDEYKQDTSEIQGQLYDKMITDAERLAKAKKDSDKKAKDEELKSLDSSYQAGKTALKQAYLNGDIKTEKEFQEKMKELEKDYLQSRLTTLEKFGEDTAKVEEQIADQGLNDAKETKEGEKKTQEKKIDSTVGKDGKLAILKAMYDADLINFEEYEKRKTEITDEHEKSRDEKVKASFETIGKAAQAAGDLVNAMMDREISKINLRYDKQIKAAKKAGKDTSKLEEAKEEEINAIRKKYADKQFMAAVLQVTATTAVAAMESFKAMAGIPVVGPALGAIAAAATIASGVAQIQVAKQQRDEAKGLYEGGFSDDYVEGYTSSGNPEEVAGVIPVHKNEFVTNHHGVANPHVRQFLDVFNIAQKNGTIRMINTTQILEQVKTRSGRYSGGYSVEDLPAEGNSWPTVTGNSSGGEQIQRVIGLLQESNQLLMVISKKELNIDGRAVRDRIRQIDQLEKNVSR